MDGTENFEVGSWTSSITRLAENPLLNMAKDAEVGGNGDGDNDETVKRSLLSPRSEKRWVSLDSFGYV